MTSLFRTPCRWRLLLNLLRHNYATCGCQRHIPITATSEDALAEGDHAACRLHVFGQVGRLRTATFGAWFDKGTTWSRLWAFIPGRVWHFFSIGRVLHVDVDRGRRSFLLISAARVCVIATSTFFVVDVEAVGHLVLGGGASLTLALMRIIIENGCGRPLKKRVQNGRGAHRCKVTVARTCWLKLHGELLSLLLVDCTAASDWICVPYRLDWAGGILLDIIFNWADHRFCALTTATMNVNKWRCARIHALENVSALLTHVITEISPLVRLSGLRLLSCLWMHPDLALRVLGRHILVHILRCLESFHLLDGSDGIVVRAHRLLRLWLHGHRWSLRLVTFDLTHGGIRCGG